MSFMLEPLIMEPIDVKSWSQFQQSTTDWIVLHFQRRCFTVASYAQC